MKVKVNSISLVLRLRCLEQTWKLTIHDFCWSQNVVILKHVWNNHNDETLLFESFASFYKDTKSIIVNVYNDRLPSTEFLGAPLEEYIKIFGGRVKLVRLPERKGLIEARVVGFEQVTGSVAVFLDAHCEVHKGIDYTAVEYFNVRQCTLMYFKSGNFNCYLVLTCILRVKTYT